MNNKGRPIEHHSSRHKRQPRAVRMLCRHNNRQATLLQYSRQTGFRVQLRTLSLCLQRKRRSICTRYASMCARTYAGMHTCMHTCAGRHSRANACTCMRAASQKRFECLKAAGEHIHVLPVCYSSYLHSTPCIGLPQVEVLDTCGQYKTYPTYNISGAHLALALESLKNHSRSDLRAY